jgi:hypothetical protein
MIAMILALIVSATLDSTTLYLGDQMEVHLSATTEANKQVMMPLLGKDLVEGVEIVSRTGIDTVVLKDGRVRYDQRLTITSFVDSLFCIDSLAFVSGQDTVWSEEVVLNVIMPIEVDTTNIAIINVPIEIMLWIRCCLFLLA